MAAFRYERELALERALTKLIRASRRALVAQERAAYWSQFGTPTPNDSDPLTRSMPLRW